MVLLFVSFLRYLRSSSTCRPFVLIKTRTCRCVVLAMVTKNASRHVVPDFILTVIRPVFFPVPARHAYVHCCTVYARGIVSKNIKKNTSKTSIQNKRLCENQPFPRILPFPRLHLEPSPHTHTHISRNAVIGNKPRAQAAALHRDRISCADTSIYAPAGRSAGGTEWNKRSNLHSLTT